MNTSFWVTSLQLNDDILVYGNLTTSNPVSITRENFADIIDNGSPSPSESGNKIDGNLFSIEFSLLFD